MDTSIATIISFNVGTITINKFECQRMKFGLPMFKIGTKALSTAQQDFAPWQSLRFRKSLKVILLLSWVKIGIVLSRNRSTGRKKN